MSPPLGSIIISPVASILGSVSKLKRKNSVPDFSILKSSPPMSVTMSPPAWRLRLFPPEIIRWDDSSDGCPMIIGEAPSNTGFKDLTNETAALPTFNLNSSPIIWSSELIYPAVVIDPVVFKLPVNIWVSSIESPNIVEPDVTTFTL